MPYPPNDLTLDYNAYRAEVIKGFAPKALSGEIHDPALIAQQKQERRERRARVRDAIRAAKQASVLAARIAGMSRDEIQARFNIGKAQQTTLLAEAERDGLMQTAKDIIVARLVPKALMTYDHHLGENSLEAARDVMKGLQLLNEKAPAAGGLNAGETEVTLREIRARFARPLEPSEGS